MKKYDVAYHNYAEAKRTQVQKQFIQTLQVTLCVRSKQPIRWNEKIKGQSPAKQFKNFQSGLLFLSTELTLLHLITWNLSYYGSNI